MNTDLVKQYLFVVIRYVSPYAAGWLSTKLGITSADASSWIATTGVVLMGLWSFANKTRYETKLNTALTLPANTTKDKLSDVIAAGDGASPLEQR